MRGKEVSPVLAAAIILAVTAVVGFVIWQQTGGSGPRGMTPEQQRKMQAMLGIPASGAPTGARPGSAGPGHP